MKSPQKKTAVPPEILGRRKGLVIVYTGDGKGKTTAALGAALRALGHGMKVAMVQFIKGSWVSGEHRACKRFGKNFEIFRTGEGFTWDTKNRKRDRELVEKGWKLARQKLLSGRYGLVILDEINYVVDYEYLDLREVLQALRAKPPKVHVILTGRSAKKGLIEAADLVSEMREVKHPFRDAKIPAQRGIDF
jgi:cob(I)alamin adenosyltransferase